MSVTRLTDRLHGWWLLNVVLVLVLAVGVLLGIQPDKAVDSDVSRADEPGQLLAQPTDFGLPPLTQYADIIERPLFIASRRYARVSAEQTAGTQPLAPPELKKYQLTAVIITGDQRLAIIQNRRSRSLLRLRVGDELDAWRVEVIAEDAVRLRFGAESRTLVLRRQSGQDARSPSAWRQRQLMSRGDNDQQQVLERPRRNLQSRIGEAASSGPEPADIRRPDRPKREVR